MSRFLFEDNIFNRTMTKLFDLLALGIYVVVCSLPIITGGAAITAAYRVMMKMQKNHEGTITGSFFREFKANLKGSFGGWLVILGSITLLAFDLSVWTSSNSSIRSIIYGFTIVLFAMALSAADWYFSIRATFEETSLSAIKNALSFSMVYLWQAVLIGIYDILMIYFISRSGYFIIHILIFGSMLLNYPKMIILNHCIDSYIEHKNIHAEAQR
ncbi:MAG: YesL family protein [Eubacterium sp.]|nr:YesL family protein [Eubacterium sp.]